ncbi:MAG: hypothetical protein K0S09_115 [Sphingobacteriaceae bacterium]|jgi:hypothetical protein|nr:hypothetical protein [Sphingobacteriaceae bacterium]
MKNFLLLGLVLGSLTSFAQDEVKFKAYFKPDKVYQTATTTSSETQVNFEGNNEKIEGIKAKGIKLPMIVSGSNELKTTIATGSVTAENDFPAELKYHKMLINQTMNGQETSSESPISGLIIKGYYNQDNKLRVDTMISDKIDQNMRNTLKSTLENIQQQITFPENPMHIGESFDQKLPMEIPVAGLNPVKVLINTNYKLKEISNGKANFDILQTVALDMNNKQANISASGGGAGTAEFDIANNLISKYESDLTMTMKTTVDDLTITAKTNTTSKQLMSVE